MAEMCGTCRFFYSPTAVCRRYPPQMHLQPIDNQDPLRHWPTQSFPSIRAEDWCGEYSDWELSRGAWLSRKPRPNR